MSTNTYKPHVPVWLLVLGAIPLIAEIIIFGLGGLAVLAQIFSASIAVGLVLVLVGGLGVGLAFAGVIVAFAGFGIWEAYSDVKNPFEYWVKMVASYLGILLGAYIAYIAGNFVLIFLSSWLMSII